VLRENGDGNGHPSKPKSREVEEPKEVGESSQESTDEEEPGEQE
jgi:hypothetical protein